MIRRLIILEAIWIMTKAEKNGGAATCLKYPSLVNGASVGEAGSSVVPRPAEAACMGLSERELVVNVGRRRIMQLQKTWSMVDVA